MKNVVIALWLLALGAAGAAAQGVATQPTEKERRDAELIWEQVVRAKGGRARLHAVTNLLLISDMGPKNLYVELNVYPGKRWDWAVGPPVPDHVTIRMSNLDLNVAVMINNKDPRPYLLEMTDWRRRSIREELLEEATAFLLETRWLQPEPLRVTRQRFGGQLLDMVETRLRDPESGLDERMDFYVEPETLLVYRVVRYYKGKPLILYCFDDYAEVDGVMMPRRYGKPSYRGRDERLYFHPLQTQLNVTYDAGIFERVPSVAAGPWAWRVGAASR